MNRFIVPLGIFALLVVVLAVAIKRAPEKGTLQSVLVGQPAPTFTLDNLSDPARKVSSADLKGSWYLLNVWGTWCAGCRHEHGMLLEIQRSGVVPIIGLNWKDDDAQALAWLADLGNPYAAVAVDRDGRVAIDWGVYGAPETFIVDDKGIVVYRYVGPITPEAWTEKFLSRLPKRQANAS